MITEAVDIAFSMVTLVPPALICYPRRFNEAAEYVEPRLHYWNDQTPSSLITIYFRPALFFSANGRIGSKGEVGNKQPEGQLYR